MWMKEIADGIYAVYARAENNSVRLLGVFALEDLVQQTFNGRTHPGV